MKGMRRQSIIANCAAKKIDIIPYSEETCLRAKSAQPAKVTRVQIVDPEMRKLEVIVEDRTLSGHRQKGPETSASPAN